MVNMSHKAAHMSTPLLRAGRGPIVCNRCWAEVLPLRWLRGRGWFPYWCRGRFPVDGGRSSSSDCLHGIKRGEVTEKIIKVKVLVFETTLQVIAL